MRAAAGPVDLASTSRRVRSAPAPSVEPGGQDGNRTEDATERGGHAQVPDVPVLVAVLEQERASGALVNERQTRPGRRSGASRCHPCPFPDDAEAPGGNGGLRSTWPCRLQNLRATSRFNRDETIAIRRSGVRRAVAIEASLVGVLGR